MKKLAYSEKIWFSPRYAVKYLSWQAEKEGLTVFASNKYKKAREAWIMGVTLFGVMKHFGARWWLQVPKDDPPDMRAMTLIVDKTLNRNEMHEREIEIMQITRYTNASIVEEIFRKLKNKAYIRETALVVYLNRTMLINDMRILSNKIKKEKINVADVWIMALESKDPDEYIVFSLFPDVQVIRFNLSSEMENLEVGDAIEMTYSTGTEMLLEKGVLQHEFIP